MAIAALSLYIVFALTAFGLRSFQHWRRTGSIGFRGVRGRVGSPEWCAGALFVAAVVLGLAGPALQQAGVVTPINPLDQSAMHAVGLFLTLAGIVLVLLSQQAMGDSWRIGVDPQETTDLVTHSLFATMRNPIFSAMALAYLGLAFMTPNVIAIVGLAALLVANRTAGAHRRGALSSPGPRLRLHELRLARRPLPARRRPPAGQPSTRELMMWQGTVALRPGQLIYAGPVGITHRHRHAAVQLVLATDEPVRLRDEAGTGRQARLAVIPSGAEHEIAGGSAGLLAWIDADGLLGQALTARVRRTRLPVDSVAAWVVAAQPLLDNGLPVDGTPIGLLDQILSELADADTPDQVPLHPALGQAVAVLPTMLDHSVHLGQVAAVVGISASRLGHLFSDELGLPFRAYVRWARLQRAIDHARQGSTLTDAAHAAGFADSAHLTRVCHEMFGLAPSLLARAVHWHEPVP